MADTSQRRCWTLRASGCLAACLILAACNGKSVAEATPDTTAAAEAASVDPHAAIVPEGAQETSAIAGTGPAEGGTAVGGVVNHEQQAKGSASKVAQPTGGDGATKETLPQGQ